MAEELREDGVSFAPSRVEGLKDVRRVFVFADRLELEVGGELVRYRFRDIAKPQEPRWLSFIKRLLGRHAWRELVADRDWFHPPQDRFFTFYTNPPVKIYMPVDEPVEHDASNFGRVQEVILSGRYATFDLAAR